MSDDISIIGPKIYSPLPKAAERKEIPVECDGTRESKWVPVTAPPLNCREISLAPQLFHDYDQALKSYLDNAKLKRKFERNLPLSPAEKQVMDKLKAAEDNIYRHGITLFSAALLTEKPSRNNLELWRAFAVRAELMPVSLTRTNTLFLLADPKLSIGDRRLLLDYCTSETGEIKPELAKRFAEHFRAVGTNYNGWQGGSYYTASHVFINVLAEILGPYDFEKFQIDLFRRDPKRFIVHLSGEEIASYSALDQGWLLMRRIGIGKDFIQTSPDFYKVLLFQRSRDLSVIALSRGFSLEKYDQVDYSLAFPGLSAKEYAAMQVVNFYSRHTAGKTYRFYQQIFETTLTRFVEGYLRAPLHKKMAYAGLLHRLDRLAYKFGISDSELDRVLTDICRRPHCQLSPRGRIGKLANLAKLKMIEVPPEGLPVEIKSILKVTGNWRLVSQHLSSIAFTPAIKGGGGSATMVVGGMAVPLLKRMDISYMNPDGSWVSAMEIAMTLVHEAAHVSWRGQDRLLRQTTPDERNAYATEYQFLNRLELIYGPSLVLSRRIELVKKFISAANRVLDYEPDDFRANKTDLPSLEFCRKHGVAGPEELDLSYYPSAGQ
jgi:hypothetical protein